MPEYRIDDIIAAAATPPGESGIAVIRVSGRNAWDLVRKIFKASKKEDIRKCRSHTVHYGLIEDKNGLVLDTALVTLFKGPNSYTGEDVVEISVHGSTANVRRILNLLFQIGARHAEPGEFTKRAFLNGKIDLTQAEAVIDVIKAKSQSSLDLAVRQLSGQLSIKIKNLKDRLMRLYAHLEAYIDFPEEDIEVYGDNQIADKLQILVKEIKELLQSFQRGSLIKEGAAVLIAGRPNVGKSSLFNTLLQRDRALVSAHPGTTRDHLEELIEIQGMAVKITDTAGLASEAKDEIDRMGMDKTRALLLSAQIYIFMVDGSEKLTKADRFVFQNLPVNKPVLTVISKTDLPQKLSEKELKDMVGQKPSVKISVKKETGINNLEEALAGIISNYGTNTESEQITRLRHKNSLEQAFDSLKRAGNAFKERESLEFVTLELKTAIDSLRELIGEVYSEDLLDAIFAEFCIGK